MNTEFTFLMTEKEPFVYLEHCKVVLSDGKLTAFFKTGNKFEIIPALTTLVIMLGSGTSISQAASIFCAQNNLYLVFARGGCYIHSVWQGGRWSPPEKIVAQSLNHDDENKRLNFAKKLIELKLKKEGRDHDFMDELTSIKTNTKLLSFEAVKAKETYKALSTHFNLVGFKRDKESREGVNSSITLLNNALYSVCTAMIISFGLHPSIGFVHGKTRRGGLAFDIADIFKYQLSLMPSFSQKTKDRKDQMIDLSSALKKNNFRIIKEIIYILRYINGEITEEQVLDILDEYSRI